MVNPVPIRNRKIVLPACLQPQLSAYVVASGDDQIYVVRDRIQGKSYDFDTGQFFILEMLSVFDSYVRLQSMFRERFGRAIAKKDAEEFFASLGERRLLTEEAYSLPLLGPFKPKPDVDGAKAEDKMFGATGIKYDTALPARSMAVSPDGKPLGHPPADQDLPPGVQDAIGMDWRTTEKMTYLFDPRPMLKVLTPVLYPIRFIIYITPILLLMALTLDWKNQDILVTDLNKLHANITLWGHLLFVFVTVHVVTTMTAAVVATAYGVSVPVVGLTFTLGFMPRWVLKMEGAEKLNRKRTMWLHGATLIARVVMFSLGSFLWYNTRDSKADLAQTGLLFFFSCAIGLLVESGNPLIKANGYYLVSAWIHEPHLRARAYSAVLNKWKGIYKSTDNGWLVAYGVIATLYIVFIILLVGFMLFKYVFGALNLGGSAMLLTVGFILYLLWLNYDGLRKFAQTFERQIQFDRWRNRTLTYGAIGAVTAVQAAPASRPRYWLWTSLAAFIIIMFLPYPYQAGGSFTIFPVLKQVISTDTPGLIDKVYFDGGESVKAGTVLATLAHEDYQSEIAVIKAQITEQAAVVDNLKTLPKPEEVAAAAQDVEIARENERYSAEKAPRLEKMYRAGAISFEEYDTARKQNLVDQQQTKAKEANLALVKVPVTADEIAAAEAKLASLKAQLASYDSKVSRTTIKMPFDGNILTLHLQDKVNSYLKSGQPFAALEATGTVTAQISVPESDISFVRLGLPVKLRAQSYADSRDFEGKVTLINRGVTVEQGGDNVVYVIATIDNHDGLLKTGMVGEAKIEGTRMPVWKAFTLTIERWVEINLWGLVP